MKLKEFSAAVEACPQSLPPKIKSRIEVLRDIVAEVSDPEFGSFVVAHDGITMTSRAGNVWTATVNPKTSAIAELAGRMNEFTKRIAESLRNGARAEVNAIVNEVSCLIAKARGRHHGNFNIEPVGWPPAGDVARERRHLDEAPNWMEAIIRLAGNGGEQ